MDEKGTVTKTEEEKWIRTQWRIQSRVGQHGDKEKISELGRMNLKLASFMMSSPSEGFEALGFPFPFSWQLARMPAYVGNDNLPVWWFTSLAQAAGLFAGSPSGLHNTGCQIGFASCEPSVGSNIPSQGETSLSEVLCHLPQGVSALRNGNCRRRQLDLLVLLLGVPGTGILRLLMSRRCLSGRNAEKIREVWKVGSKGCCSG